LLHGRAAALQREVDQRRRAETERAKLETQLQQAQRLEAVGRLTGGIAHDFNNLLTVILGNLDMVLTDDKEIDANQRAAIAGATKAAKRGASLTQRLLAFSRRQPLQPGAIDLRHLLSEMDEMLARTLGGTIRITVQIPADLWPCLADRAQLESALLNLAINARDAMPHGGDLFITAGNEHVKEGAVFGPETAGAGQYIEIAVTDTGTGMAPDVLARSLDPFFTTKPAGKGSGLGLSMVYGFVRQSGGYLTIDSTPGEGTTVHILLPRSGQPATEEPVPEPRDVPETGGLILVVEDSPEVLKVTVRILKRLGYETVSATSVDDALHRLADLGHLTLVLTDVMLSGRSGTELGREVARQRPGTPVVYMSGYSGDVLAKDGQLPAGVELIQKPFRPEELGARLAAVQARHRRG
jgi:nitrogen-specific signal transduction histidine kinase